MGCAELVDALEQRLRGEHAGPLQAALDAHLPSCTDCRDYLAVAARVERELMARAEAPPPAALEVARTNALTFVEHVRGVDRRLQVLMATLVSIPLVERLSGGPWVGPGAVERVATVVLATGVMAAVLVWVRVILRRRGAPLTLARDDGELLTAYRALVDRELRKVPAQRLLVIAMALAFGGAALAALLEHHAPIAALLAAQVVALGIVAPTVWRHGASLRREHAALQRGAT